MRLRLFRASAACLIGLLTIGIAPIGAGQQAQSSKPGTTAIKAARMIEVKTGTVVPNVTVVIEGDRIVSARTNGPVPAGARVIDLGNATLLPGLIDCHTHLLTNLVPVIDEDANGLLTIARLGTVRRSLLGAAMARQDLEAGITTVRDLGNSGLNGDVALRDAINKGWVPGPRVFASTRALSAIGGQFRGFAHEAQPLIANEYAQITGADEARRAVRQAFYDGADLIKVIVNTDAQVLTVEEMKVIVEEAHRVKKKVAAHAIGGLATRVAVDAGVDSIEHAYTVPNDVLKDMAAKHIFLVPTDGTVDVYVELVVKPQAKSPEEVEEGRKQFTEFAKQNHDRLSRAIKMGVPIAAGSDMYYALDGKTRGEASLTMLHAYVEAGMRPVDIIKAATVNAAELLGQAASLGAIEPKMFADIIAVDEDPLTDIRALDHVVFVMKGGAVVKSAR